MPKQPQKLSDALWKWRGGSDAGLDAFEQRTTNLEEVLALLLNRLATEGIIVRITDDPEEPSHAAS